MPRYKDEWVIERVMFDYISGGSCACCGFQHFLPNGTADLVDALSDLDTDQANQEKAALANHPWPAELRDQVWADRVRLRQKLKKDRTRFADFWQAHGSAFEAWCREKETVEQLRRWLQLPRSGVMEVIQQKYDIHSAFGVVLCAVVEQVAGFKFTEYAPDGKGSMELDFETKLLTYDRRGGFVLRIVSEDGILQDDMLDIWLARMKALGGSVLLDRGPSTSTKDTEEGDPDGPTSASAKPSFSSDRRIVRLVVARVFADMLQDKFQEQQKQLVSEQS